MERVGRPADKCIWLDADLSRDWMGRLCSLPARPSSAAYSHADTCRRLVPQVLAPEPVHSLAGHSRCWSIPARGGRLAANPRVTHGFGHQGFLRRITLRRSGASSHHPVVSTCFKPEGEMMQMVFEQRRSRRRCRGLPHPHRDALEGIFRPAEGRAPVRRPAPGRRGLWPLVVRRLVAASHPVPGAARRHGRDRAACAQLRIRPIARLLCPSRKTAPALGEEPADQVPALLDPKKASGHLRRLNVSFRG